MLVRDMRGEVLRVSEDVEGFQDGWLLKKGISYIIWVTTAPFLRAMTKGALLESLLLLLAERLVCS